MEAEKHRFVEEPEVLRSHDYSGVNQNLHDVLDKQEKRYKLGVD